MFFMLLVFAGCQKDELLITSDTSQTTLETARAAYPSVLSLPDGFQPEGVAIASPNDFYVGSLVTGRIYRGDLRTGAGEIFYDPGIQSQAAGLAVDARSGYLFAAGGFTGALTVVDTREDDPAQRHVATYSLASPGTSLINDVIVTRTAAYVTNSLQAVLYKIPLGMNGQLPSPSKIKSIPLTGDFSMTPNSMIPNLGAFANGIDATSNGHYLVVANTDRGEIYLVNRSSGEAELIDLGGMLLPFADGLILDGKTLYVVQNLMNQIAVIQLADDLRSGNVVKTITSGKFGVPTTIAEFGKYLYAVNAHFDIAPPTDIHPDVEFEVVKVRK